MRRICFFLALVALPAAASQVPTVADKGAPAKIAITNRDEPGERLIVAGGSSDLMELLRSWGFGVRLSYGCKGLLFAWNKR
jgi:hypothetical protein